MNAVIARNMTAAGCAWILLAAGNPIEAQKRKEKALGHGRPCLPMGGKTDFFGEHTHRSALRRQLHGRAICALIPVTERQEKSPSLFE